MRDRGLGDRRAWRQLRALALLPLVAASLAGCGAANPAKQARPMFGFNDAAGAWSYPLQARTGALIRRVLVGWDQVQPEPTVWNWTQTDGLYRGLVRQHLRPLFVALAAPCWAHPTVPCGGRRIGVFAPDAGFDGAWAAFVQRLARRYPAAVGIEIWNEENLLREFLPSPSPARYTQLLQAAYRAVKSVDRTMPVISGGLFDTPITGGGTISDWGFLSGMYAAGARGFLDGIGVHPYPVVPGAEGVPAHYDPARMEQILSRIRAVRARADDTDTPLWVTEVGVSTASYPGSPVPASDKAQAADLTSMLDALERDGDVRAVIVHQLIDPPPSTSPLPGHDPGYGAFLPDEQPKPAACALSAAFNGQLRC